MPPKKKTTKRPAAKRKKMATAEPDQVLENLRLDESEDTSGASQEIPEGDFRERIVYQYAPKKKTARWMWTGVIGFFIVIFIFWSWSFKIMAFSAWPAAAESKIINNVSQGWQEIDVKQQALEEQKEIIKNQIKNILDKISQTQTETTSSPISTTSTTTEISATTTPENLNSNTSTLN